MTEHCRTKIKQGLGTHLFVKVPRPEDSEGIFSVFGLRVKLPPVITTVCETYVININIHTD